VYLSLHVLLDLAQGEPVPPKKTKFGSQEVTLWSRIDIKLGDATLQEVLDYLRQQYNLEVDVLGTPQSHAPCRLPYLSRVFSCFIWHLCSRPNGQL
jgi:hypothetical protein